jgi:hypothetical protein
MKNEELNSRLLVEVVERVEVVFFPSLSPEGDGDAKQIERSLTFLFERR